MQNCHCQSHDAQDPHMVEFVWSLHRFLVASGHKMSTLLSTLLVTVTPYILFMKAITSKNESDVGCGGILVFYDIVY